MLSLVSDLILVTILCYRWYHPYSADNDSDHFLNMCARHCAKLFTDTLSLSPPNNPMRWVLWSPLFRWGNWGLDSYVTPSSESGSWDSSLDLMTPNPGMLHLLLGNQGVPRGTRSVDSHILERLRKRMVANRVMNVEQSGPFHFLVLPLPFPLSCPYPSFSWTTKLAIISGTWNVSQDWVSSAFSRVNEKKNN